MRGLKFGQVALLTTCAHVTVPLFRAREARRKKGTITWAHHYTHATHMLTHIASRCLACPVSVFPLTMRSAILTKGCNSPNQVLTATHAARAAAKQLYKAHRCARTKGSGKSNTLRPRLFKSILPNVVIGPSAANAAALRGACHDAKARSVAAAQRVTT